MAVHGGRERTVLAHQLGRHQHAVPLAALLELGGLHGDERCLRDACIVDDHHVVVGRVLDVVAVVQIVFVVARFAVRAAQNVRRGWVHRDGSAAAGAAWCPLNVLAHIGHGDHVDAVFAVVQLAGHSVHDHAGHRTIHHTHFWAGVGQQAQERKRKVFLAHAVKATVGIVFKVSAQCNCVLFVLLNCYLILAHD